MRSRNPFFVNLVGADDDAVVVFVWCSPVAVLDAAAAAARTAVCSGLTWWWDIALNSATIPRVATRRCVRSISNSLVRLLDVALALRFSAANEFVATVNGTCNALICRSRFTRRLSFKVSCIFFSFSACICNGVFVLDKTTVAGVPSVVATFDLIGADNIRFMAFAIPVVIWNCDSASSSSSLSWISWSSLSSSSLSASSDSDSLPPSYSSASASAMSMSLSLSLVVLGATLVRRGLTGGNISTAVSILPSGIPCCLSSSLSPSSSLSSSSLDPAKRSRDSDGSAAANAGLVLDFLPLP